MKEPLFSSQAHPIIPISTELWSVAQLAAVILLFLTGLETDLSLFRRYGPKAFVVAIAGIIFPFIFADALTVLFGVTKSFMDPAALAMGAISTATSVGITARILEELDKVSTPEGVSILAAAVIDDVLGIIVLALVGSIVEAQSYGKPVNALGLAKLAASSFGFWLMLTVGAILIAPFLARLIRRFRSEGALIGLTLGICFAVAAVTEEMGLAMIIGAYALGLAFSRTDVADELRHVLEPVVHFTVPIFFVVMGMLVNFKAMGAVVVFGLVMTVFAIIGKVVGCGGASLLVGFNVLGGTRIGVGMLPRGEVALIVAGIAIAKGWIPQKEFGVAIMFIFVTTLLAPIFLLPLFKNETSGLRPQKAK